MKNYTIHVDRGEIFSWIIGNNQAGRPDSGGAPEQNLLRETEQELLQQIEQAAKKVETAASARYFYAVFPLKPPAESGQNPDQKTDGISGGNTDRENAQEKIHLAGTSLTLTGRDICSLLRECSSCILLALTLGASLDRLLRRAQISSMADAFLLDLCASNAAEELCDAVNRTLEEEFERRGSFLTDRFSPGYGDLSIGLQGEICRVLQTEKRIGLTANSSSILIPSKSITAIIGIADRPQPKKISGCRNCRMKETCGFRKAGKTCE